MSTTPPRRKSLLISRIPSTTSIGRPATKMPKRRPVSMGYNSKAVVAPSSAPTTPSTPQSAEYSEGAAGSNSGMTMQALLRDQQDDIYRLGNEVTALRNELAARPTQEDLDSLRGEWQTSEELFVQSQKDNEHKHAQIESMRQYIKTLEGKLEEQLGDSWKSFCNVQSPMTHSTSFASTTPLPKPGTGLRSSASLKRASRNSRLSTVSTSDPRLASLKDERCEKTTPATALSKLEGIRESTRSTSSDDRSLVDFLIPSTSAPGSVSRPSPKHIVNSFCSDMAGGQSPSPSKASTPSSFISSPAHAHHAALSPQLAEQIASLAAMMKSLPSTLVAQIEQATARNAETDADRDADRAARVEDQKRAMIEMIDAAERRADARESRLQSMLAEAKTCSGQMEW